MKRALAGLAAVTALVAVACAARAHGFDERYDLPVPLSWVVAAACAVVALTFVAAALFARRGAGAATPRRRLEFTLPRGLRLVLRALSFVLFLLTLAAALWGSRDPLMNLAPTLIWIVWWLGLSFLSACVGGIWALLDPWRTAFDLITAAARTAGFSRGAAQHWHWPARIGLWPAALLLLAWCWLEVVYPLASLPFKLGVAALAWSVVNVGGMLLFGRATWQSRADVFALVFSTLGRMAPLRLRGAMPTPPQAIAGQAAFVMAMLTTVIFDGLHGGAAWNLFEGLLRKLAPRALDINGLVAGTTGLVVVWLLFLCAYAAMLRASLALLRPPGDADVLAAELTMSLVPIALAYSVAHNFSSLLVQGQNVFQLLSDPFGLQWNLFGTARWYPNIGIVDARTTWFVAVSALVLGHALSIWWSHRVVLAAGVPPQRAAAAMLPLTLLMVATTGISLTLIAEPMVL